MQVWPDLYVVVFLGHDAVLAADLLLNAAVKALVPLPRLLIHAVVEILQHFQLCVFHLNAVCKCLTG